MPTHVVIQNILEESDFKTKSVKNAQVQQVTSSLLEDLRTLYDSYLHKMVRDELVEILNLNACSGTEHFY